MNVFGSLPHQPCYLFFRSSFDCSVFSQLELNTFVCFGNCAAFSICVVYEHNSVIITNGSSTVQRSNRSTIFTSLKRTWWDWSLATLFNFCSIPPQFAPQWCISDPHLGVGRWRNVVVLQDSSPLQIWSGIHCPALPSPSPAESRCLSSLSGHEITQGDKWRLPSLSK